MRTKTPLLALCTAMALTACTKQADEVVAPAASPNMCTGKAGGQCPAGDGDDRPTTTPYDINASKTVELGTGSEPATWAR